MAAWFGQLAYGYDPQNAPDLPEEHEFRPVTSDGVASITCRICRQRWDHPLHLDDLDAEVD